MYPYLNGENLLYSIGLKSPNISQNCKSVLLISYILLCKDVHPRYKQSHVH